MMLRTKGLECALAQKKTRRGPRTHESTRVYTARASSAPPDVMCVSVYVDRDQRWVLKHFRPLLSPQP